MKTPRSRLYAIAGFGCAVIVIAAVLYGNNARTVHAGAEPPSVLDKLKLVDTAAAPDAAFLDAMGKTVRLADFRGRYVLLNLWATWCGPCITELPELAKLNSELPQDRMTVVPVDMLEKVDAEKLGAFLAMHDAGGLPVYTDREFSVQRGFVANELPLTVLIDAEGRVIAKAAGAQKWADPASVAYFKTISAPSEAK